MNAALAQMAPRPAPVPARSRADLTMLAGLLLVLLVAQHASYASMLAVWQRSQTFAHGFIILPVSLWLLWRQRAELARLPRRPSASALPVLAGLCLLWLLAALANVSALLQYCAVLMIPAVVAASLGWRLAGAAAFPLAYLLLAVPFGEVFIPPLIDFTARFTVAALQLSGIPVFRDNNHFSLPSGNWDVVEACSGLRYVMASLALGALFAYLNYRSPRRRLLFLLISCALPVLANGVRAYLIVMIGHLSDLRLAAGIDHLIYGWLFFGLVSLLLFWFGAAWRDQPPDAVPAPPRSADAAEPLAAPSNTRLAWVAAAASALMLSAPLASRGLLSEPPPSASDGDLAVSDPAPPWRRVSHSPLTWQAPHAGHPHRYAASFSDGQHAVAVQLTWYPHQYPGAELLTPAEVPAGPGMPQWHEIANSERVVAVGAQYLPVRATIMQAGANKLLVWRSYRLDGVTTASWQRIKWELAVAKLLRRPDDGAELMLASAFDEQSSDAAVAMQRLLPALLPAINEGLDHARRR